MKSKISVMILFLWCGLLIVWGFLNVRNNYNLPESKVGIADVMYQQIDIDDKIVQIINDNNCIFILYSQSDENIYIQAYNLNGTYEYTISVNRDGATGHAHIMLHEGKLLVHDYQYNIYIFEKGQQIAFYVNDNSPKWTQTLNFTEQSSNYVVKYGSIWYENNEDSYCFISRSLNAFINQYGIERILNAVFFLLIIVFECKSRHNQQKTEQHRPTIKSQKDRGRFA